MSRKTDKNQEKKRPSILNALFSKPERDNEYMSDLNTQWDKMEKPERTKFVFGVVFGAIVFFAALGLVLWLIGTIMN